MNVRFAIAAPARIALWERRAVDGLVADGCGFVAHVELPARAPFTRSAAFARSFPRSAQTFAAATALVEAPTTPQRTPEAPERFVDLDFLLWLGDGEPPSWTRDLTRWGCWRIAWDDGSRSVPGAHAVAQGLPTVSVRIERLRVDTVDVIFEAIIPVRATSLHASLESVLARAISAPVRACRAIDAAGDVRSLRGLTPAEGEARARITLPDVRALAARVGSTRIGRVLRRLSGEDEVWRIGVVAAQDAADAVAPRGTAQGASRRPLVRWLDLPSRDRFWADPFALHVSGRTYLLCEVFPFSTQRGAIASVEVRDSRVVGEPQVVLDRPYHLSYPFVIVDGDRRYCVPESHQDRRATLYDLSDPLHWSPIATLIDDFAAVDPTVVRYGERWWLFCTNHDEDANADLYLWHSESLAGPWLAHPANPVKSDVTSSRPAGTPFVRDGTLFRPAQDCSQGYGSRIVLNRVVDLSTTRFHEEADAFIEPQAHGACRHGMHTLSLDESICFVDGKERVHSAGAAWRSAALYAQRALARLTRALKEKLNGRLEDHGDVHQ